MSTYEMIGLKAPLKSTLAEKIRGLAVAQVAPPISAAKGILAANVYQLPRKGDLFAANVYPQDELRGANKDALFAVNKVELRGVKEVIRSFRRFKKLAGDLRFLPCAWAHVGAYEGRL